MKFISKKLAMSTVSFSAVVLLGAVASMTGACTITTTDDSDGGLLDNDSGVIDTDSGADGATQATLPFQPSNVLLSGIDTTLAAAADVSGNCAIQTGGTTDCFPNGYAVQDITQSDSSKVHVIVVSSLTVEPSAKITVSGGLPLILISIGDVHLNGTIDANGAGSTAGPGGFSLSTSNAAGSGPGGGPAATGTPPGVAAGGASYCGIGGTGGAEQGAAAAGAPLAAYGAIDLRPLAGGSSGGGGTVGNPGGGGGGIQIVSGGTFTMAQGSYINVGGGGGGPGGTNGQNASGGGAGGSILIEATTVSLSGILAANGGGGGSGGGSGYGGDATPNATPSPGGTNVDAPQSAGGAGGAAASIDGRNGGDLAGSSAGAGGGGAGRIRINTTSGNVDFSTATLSPSAGSLADGGTDVDGGTSSCVTQGVVRAAGTGI